jgi:hypothetical protein
MGDRMENSTGRIVGSGVLCLAVFCGCGGDVQVSPHPVSDGGNNGGCQVSTPPRVLSNNSAEIDGPRYGWGTNENDALRKPIRIDLLQPDPRFTAERAYALREHTDFPFFEIAFMVTNVSTMGICFIELDGYRLKNAMGFGLTPVAMFSPFLVGSVLEANQVAWTDTCLLPGESGWLLDFQGEPDIPNLYSLLAAVEFQYQPRMFMVAAPPPRVVPDGYAVIPPDDPDNHVTLCYTNSGTGPAVITDQGFTRFLMLDDAGNPLVWDFATTAVRPAMGPLNPGQSGSSSTEFRTLYTGRASRMRSFIDFGPPATVSDAAPSLALDANESRRSAWNALTKERWARRRELLSAR